MKKFIRPLIKYAALAAGFLFAVASARSLSAGYDNYARMLLGDFLRIRAAFSVPLFLVFAGLFVLCVYFSPGGVISSLKFWRAIDAALLAVLACGAAILCVHLTIREPFYYNYLLYRFKFLFFPAAAYISVMAACAEIAARVRDSRLVSTLYWPRFFSIYPARKPFGFLMAVLLSGNLIILFIVYSAGILANSTQSVAPLLFAMFTLSALTYICAFVQSLSAGYEKANAEKIRAERFKSELITNVSHDIRTPITTIINYTALLRALPVENDEFIQYTEILEKKAARLKTLIDDLMEASKAGAGSIEADMNELDLSEIVGQISGEYADRFAEVNIALALRQPEARVPVTADGRLLWRVLENLFDNAAKYSLPGTRVFAEIVSSGDAPVFLLKNTSSEPIDMPGDILTEQFIRGDRARLSEGSGLGLYIAKSLVELMGGRFTIRATGDLFEAEIRFGNRHGNTA